MFRTSLIATALLAASLAGPAAAQRGVLDDDGATRSLIEQLRPTTRGIRLPSEAPPAGTPTTAAPGQSNSKDSLPPRAAVLGVPPPPRPAAVEAPAVSITVTFPSGSAIISDAAARTLAPLGRALASSDLAAYRFRIEGHTDTVGDPRMNRVLSERRAAAVREFLARAYNVDPRRLEAVGLGQDQLLVETPPGVPEARNRRVQVVNLGS